MYHVTAKNKRRNLGNGPSDLALASYSALPPGGGARPTLPFRAICTLIGAYGPLQLIKSVTTCDYHLLILVFKNQLSSQVSSLPPTAFFYSYSFLSLIT